jgi:hypothetical protein
VLQLQRSFGLLKEFFPFGPVSDAVISICYWFTILLSIFIFFLYKFWATMCHHQEKVLYLCDSGICHSMGGVWSAGWSETPDATHTE